MLHCKQQKAEQGPGNENLLCHDSLMVLSLSLSLSLSVLSTAALQGPLEHLSLV